MLTTSELGSCTHKRYEQTAENTNVKVNIKLWWEDVATCSHQQKLVTAIESASDHKSTTVLVVMLPSFDNWTAYSWDVPSARPQHRQPKTVSLRLVIITPPPVGDGVLFSGDFFLYFFVSNIMRKWLDQFARNFQGRCGVTMGRPD